MQLQLRQSGEDISLCLWRDPLVIVFEFLMPVLEGTVAPPPALLQILLERSGPAGWPVHGWEFLDTGVLSMGH